MKKLLVLNHKMGMLYDEVYYYIDRLNKINTDLDIIVCPSNIYLEAFLNNCDYPIGAQNIHWADNGAFTGEISGEMLKDIGVEYVIIGHSERRQYFAETDETVNNRLKAALKYELKPIVCVGELLEEREAGITNKVLETQVKGALKDISGEDVANIVIAYEPVWAIGTGKTASSEDANDACRFIRNTVKELYSEDVANRVRIQYGGSVKASNANELFNTTDIDGGLVGGASLKADEFVAIVNYKKAENLKIKDF